MDLDSCLAALKSPGVVAFPTDTFYALSCDPSEPVALSKLRQLKGLDSDRPLPLLIPRDYDLAVCGCTVSDNAAQLMQSFWPGKLTVILPCTGALAAAVGRSADGAIGVRAPDTKWLLRLLERMETPLVGTSANPTGQPPARTSAEVRSYFGAEVAVLDEADAEGGQPSTVVDCTGGAFEIVREGAISSADILQHQESGNVS